MNYITGRSLFYYYLLHETVVNACTNDWRKVSERFGVDENDITQIEPLLHNIWLNDLESTVDIMMYCNFIQSGFSKNIQSLFGVNPYEWELIEIKKSALLCAYNFFGEETKLNRLCMLAHGYGNDSTASVLYALILERNGGQANDEFAKSILQKELTQGNGDAGLILLKSVRASDKSRVLSDLSMTAEMAAHPEALRTAAKMYGYTDIDVKFKSKQPIGFGRIDK